MVKKDKRARIVTALTIAGVMLLGVAVAPVAATIGTDIGTQLSSFDDQDKAQRCKKNKKSKKKKCKKQSPAPTSTATPTGAPSSPAPSASGTAAPTPAPSGSAPAGGGEGRVVEFEYVCPCTGRLQLGSLLPVNFGGGSLTPEPGETSVTAVVEDDSGQDVGVRLAQIDDAGANSVVGRFCGATTEPIPINPAADLNIFAGDLETCAAVGAGGVITFTFIKG